MMFDSIQNVFLVTLQYVVSGKSLDWSLYASLKRDDWTQLYQLAKQQGVVAVLFEGIQQLPKNVAPPLNLLMQWSAQVFAIENKQETMSETAADFAQLMSEYDIRTMVLKGKAFSTYYPYPNHRECGDLDCFLMGKYAEGNQIVAKHGGDVEVDSYKHSHIEYKRLVIENHQYLTSFDNTKRGIYTERMLQDVIAKGGNQIENTYLWNPSCDFNALFLVEHALRHFLKEGIVVRHLLDWAYLLKVEQHNINWDFVYTQMEKCRLRNFADVLTFICVEYLGLELINPLVTYAEDKSMVEAVLIDILSGSHVIGKENFAQKVLRTFRRFQRIWRFRNVANENFATLVWNTFAFSSYLHRSVKI